MLLAKTHNPNATTSPRLAHCLICATVALFLLGCNGAEEGRVTQATQASTKETPHIDKQVVLASATTSVTPTHSPQTGSPAKQTDLLPPKEAPPEIVCEKFMKLLQSGNRVAAENLLTRAALATTMKEGLELEPMGSVTASYKFSEVRFATQRQKLAQVDCQVNDTAGDEKFSLDLTWVARKQASGWRISGVMLELEEGKVKDFLSFENLQDVQRLKLMAGGKELDELDKPPTLQAKQNNTTQQK